MHIFFHIPKAAGTNFSRKLVQATGATNPLTVVRPLELAFLPDSVLNKKDFVGGHFGWAVLERIAAQKKTYTILRDPVARIVSQYKYMVKLTQEGRLKKGAMIRFVKRENRCIATKEELKDILRDEENPYIEGAFRNSATWTFVSNSDPISRWEADDSALLTIAKNNLARVDFVGIAEEMDATFDLLSYRLGTQIANDSRDNNTDDISFDVDDELIALIEENNRLDLELYRWGKKLFHDRCKEVLGKKKIALTPNNFSGPCWRNGVRTDGASNAFYFLAPSTSEICVGPGDLVEFAATGNAHVVRVDSSEQNGLVSVFVTVDKRIDPAGDGFPNKVLVESKTERRL
jgi:hypothetical protein